MARLRRVLNFDASKVFPNRAPSLLPISLKGEIAYRFFCFWFSNSANLQNNQKEFCEFAELIYSPNLQNSEAFLFKIESKLHM